MENTATINIEEKQNDVDILSLDNDVDLVSTSTKDGKVDKEILTKQIYNIIRNSPTFKCIDEAESSRAGRTVCVKYAKYIEAKKVSMINKETGKIPPGSVIIPPEKNVCMDGQKILKDIIKDEQNPASEFYKILSIIGKIDERYKTVLYLLYVFDLKHREACQVMGLKSKEVSEIKFQAHVLVAHLTGKTVLK